MAEGHLLDLIWVVRRYAGGAWPDGLQVVQDGEGFVAMEGDSADGLAFACRMIGFSLIWFLHVVVKIGYVRLVVVVFLI